MAKFKSKSNGEIRTSRSNNSSIRYDKYIDRPGSKKGHDHSGMVVDFIKGVVKIFGSGENLGKR